MFNVSWFRSLVFLRLIGIHTYRCNLMLEKHARSNEGALRGHEKTRNFRFVLCTPALGRDLLMDDVDFERR